jgi:hypothetical protein
VPLSTETHLGDHTNERFHYAPTDHAPTQTTYHNSTRIWVDTPISGGQKASENPNKSKAYLATIDPYIGSKAYVPKRDFKAIKDFKDTDAADYNQYYNN